jgi:hypothetical protein
MDILQANLREEIGDIALGLVTGSGSRSSLADVVEIGDPAQHLCGADVGTALLRG